MYGVVSTAAPYRVIPGHAIDVVVAIAAINFVVTTKADDRVVAFTPQQRVVGCVRSQNGNCNRGGGTDGSGIIFNCVLEAVRTGESGVRRVLNQAVTQTNRRTIAGRAGNGNRAEVDGAIGI